MIVVAFVASLGAAPGSAQDSKSHGHHEREKAEKPDAPTKPNTSDKPDKSDSFHKGEGFIADTLRGLQQMTIGTRKDKTFADPVRQKAIDEAMNEGNAPASSDPTKAAPQPGK